MIILLAASAVSLTALQASVSAPREAFRTCLKQASGKAANEKVVASAYEAYIRTNCSNELDSFKSAAVGFDMKNKMSKKDASADADSMIADFVSSALANYKYVTGADTPTKQAATAPATAATAPAAATTPAPTPASEPQSPH